MSSCCGDGIPSCEAVFDERAAQDDLRRYRKDGPAWATGMLIDALARGVDLEDASVIDIGAGIGVVHLELLQRGAARATDIDGSSAYVAVARARGRAARPRLTGSSTSSAMPRSWARTSSRPTSSRWIA